ncbi:MAG: hypothetical protein ABIH71_02360 [Candidatus Omnitrophota bacterium]
MNPPVTLKVEVKVICLVERRKKSRKLKDTGLRKEENSKDIKHNN